MKLPRRLLITLSILLPLGVVSAAGARSYLSSRQVAYLVAGRLQSLLGVPVRVQAADIGLTGGSTFKGLELFEPGDDPPPPWLTVGDASADVSAFGALAGADTPDQVTLRHIAVELRFDRAGHLLTRMPQRAGQAPKGPHLLLNDGSLTLAQEGRPPLVLTGIRADVTASESGYHLEGTLEAPAWGSWQVRGALDKDKGEVSLELKTPEVVLDQARLTALPFVSPRVWQQVQAEGVTAVQILLTYEPRERGLHYRVELAPRETRVRVRSIDLDADQARGRVVVEDALVQLRDICGRTAGGEIRTTADLDFRRSPAQLRFDSVAVHRVALHGLPRTWKMPPLLDGLLTGEASLRVTVAAGRARTQGTGQGYIDQPRVVGIPGKGKIRLRLVADGQGFHFPLDQSPEQGSGVRRQGSREPAEAGPCERRTSGSDSPFPDFFLDRGPGVGSNKSSH